MKQIDETLLKSNIEKIAQYDFDNHKVFGSAYCVIQNDRVIYQNCFGNTSINTSDPVNENTLFRLASMTKPITAVAALILVERGLLSLSDKVSDYLPQYKDLHIMRVSKENELIDEGSVHTEVTVHHLLTHTSGIGNSPEKARQMTDVDRGSLDGSVNFYAKAGLDFEPGSQAQYSPTGAFDVLVKIIELASKTDFPTFLKQEIFEPCEMTDTTFEPTPEQWSRIVNMHNRVDGANCVYKMWDGCIFETIPCAHYLGGAGLSSTLADYARFARMLLNEGQADKKRILKAETLRLLHTPYVPFDKHHSWGLGVRVVTNETYRGLPVGAFGWSGAYGSHFWIDPENRVAAVFMKNSRIDGGAGNESARNFEKAVDNSFKEE